MPDKSDLTTPKNFTNWALYGLTATITTIASVAYMDMRSQRNQCQEENNYYARQSFDNALKIKAQDQTIKALDTAITEAKSYIQDSIQPVNVKNFRGNIKIKNK